MNIYRILLELIKLHAQSATLERVLDSFGVAVATCSETIAQAEQSGNQDYIDAVVDDQCAVVENVIGAAFVASQADLTATISHVKRLHARANTDGHVLTSSDGRKAGILRLGNALQPGLPYSDVEVINAFANYFKHHDEWNAPWTTLTGQSKETADTIMAFGATEGSTGNLRQATRALGVTDSRDLVSLSGLIERWRQTIVQRYESELQRIGLL
jgi:hypothetical protein